ncbi:PLDc N-terminal domain-containing protein [Candidatus Woesearchaeota archaeon]|nr:PLDc N-terminal domain-containing protein [Candidatus Woesearchaeota archaeon]
MKKCGVWVFAIIFLVVLVGTGLAADSNIVDYENVRVTLLNQNPDPAEPGGFVELRFNVENTGSTVDEAKFEILEEFPFEVVSEAVHEISEFKGAGDNSYTLYYKLKVSEDAVEGDNEIKLRFTLGLGKWVTAGPFVVRVKTHDAVLDIEEISTEPSRLMAGDEGELRFELKNYADSLLKDVHVKLDVSSGDFTPVGSTNERTVNQLSSGDSVSLSYNLYVDADADAKVHQIPVELTYSDETDTVYSKNLTIGLYVDGDPEYFLNLEDSDVYEAGKRGKIVLSVSNIGPSDMKFLTIELKESPDYEVISNRKEYLGNLESDDFETAEFQIHINNVQKELPLLVKLIYKDSYNKEFEMDETVMLKIYSDRDAVKYGFDKGVSLMPMILTVVGVAVLIFLFGFWVFMLIDIFKHPLRDSNKQLLWIFLMVVLLFIGAILYYVFARRRR